jgi:hypothetical protein
MSAAVKVPRFQGNSGLPIGLEHGHFLTRATEPHQKQRRLPQPWGSHRIEARHWREITGSKLVGLTDLSLLTHFQQDHMRTDNSIDDVMQRH